VVKEGVRGMKEKRSGGHSRLGGEKREKRMCKGAGGQRNFRVIRGANGGEKRENEQIR